MKIWALLFAVILLLPGYARAEKTPVPGATRCLMTTTYDAPYSFEETVAALRETIEAHNFRTFPDRFLEQGLTDEFSVNQRQLSIRFCNFSQLYQALQLEPRLGVLLPCAITVVEHENGDVQLIAANIEAIAEIFDNDQLSGLMAQLQQSYDDILEEVTF